jgi:hypothetical protein
MPNNRRMPAAYRAGAAPASEDHNALGEVRFAFYSSMTKTVEALVFVCLLAEFLPRIRSPEKIDSHGV